MGGVHGVAAVGWGALLAPGPGFAFARVVCWLWPRGRAGSRRVVPVTAAGTAALFIRTCTILPCLLVLSLTYRSRVVVTRGSGAPRSDPTRPTP